MKVTDRGKVYIKPVFIIALLIALLGIVTACEDFGYPATTTPEEPSDTVKVSSPTVISTKDAAILAVYQQLLSQAESHDAKLYLADFYAYCDNWSAESEFFKDGSSTWYVAVDMTSSESWELPLYWKQASWFVFKDGKVIPSNRFRANALRIEADLQALNSELESGTSQESEGDS